MATSPHVASLTDAKPILEKGGPSITGIGVDDLPLLKRLSIRRLVLAPGAVREPHWHTSSPTASSARPWSPCSALRTNTTGSPSGPGRCSSPRPGHCTSSRTSAAAPAN